MNDLKRKYFLDGILPILESLNSKWFPPDKKTPDGKYFYSCSYCDQNCGQHDKHDDDCYYQRAKNTIEAFNDLDLSDKWNLNHDGTPRKQNEIDYFKNYMKYRAVFKHFIQDVSDFVPLDYSDPANKSIICQCHHFGRSKNDHDPSCVNLQVSKILRNLFEPTKRRPKELRRQRSL